VSAELVVTNGPVSIPKMEAWMLHLPVILFWRGVTLVSDSRTAEHQKGDSFLENLLLRQ
jgi:hypothetical protein